MTSGTGLVSVIGLWHLGLVTAACLADLGRTVVGFDANPELIGLLRKGQLPLFEPGLDGLVAAGVANGRLRFTADPAEAIPEASHAILAYDTAVGDDDESDLSQVMAGVRVLAKHIGDGCMVVVSSQVPVGTTEAIGALIRKDRPTVRTGVACLPENLRLGQAIERFKRPDMIVIGADGPAAAGAVDELLAGIDAPRVVVDIRTAEMTKHALNAYLATNISFANEMANLCDAVGADALEVARALRLDRRIGPSAPLRPGLGFAGGTLARDLKALVNLGKRKGAATPLIDGVLAVNEHQNQVVGRKLAEAFGSLRGLRVGILGLTYKPGTSTLRRSAALDIIGELTALGADVRAHDPRANLDERPASSGFELCPDALAAAEGSDALVIVTEWPEFRNLDFEAIKRSMRTPVLLDAQNSLNAEEMGRLGFTYLGVGRGSALPRPAGGGP